jgi:hypothetical protein
VYFTYVSHKIHNCIPCGICTTQLTRVSTRWFKYDRDLCGLFTHKSVPVIFEPPCSSSWTNSQSLEISVWSLVLIAIINPCGWNVTKIAIVLFVSAPLWNSLTITALCSLDVSGWQKSSLKRTKKRSCTFTPRKPHSAKRSFYKLTRESHYCLVTMSEQVWRVQNSAWPLNHEPRVMYVTYALGNEKHDATWLQQKILHKICPTPEHTSTSKQMRL